MTRFLLAVAGTLALSAAPPGEVSKLETVDGVVAGIAPDAIEVKVLDGSTVRLDVPPDTPIAFEGRQLAGLQSVKEGDAVRARYEVSGEARQVLRLDVTQSASSVRANVRSTGDEWGKPDVGGGIPGTVGSGTGIKAPGTGDTDATP